MSPDMLGEIGVIFNVPQPFTVRTKRLSQVIRISHNHFKQLVQPLSEDGKIVISNFLQHLRGLKKEELEEIPFVEEFLADSNIEAIQSTHEPQNYGVPSQESNGIPTFYASSNTLPARVVLHGHHPDDKQEEENGGKLAHLPDSMEDLLTLAEKKLGKRGTTVLMANGSQVEDISALRDNDHLYIF
ncbi:Potassium channel KAT3 [Forsythia ovata]|uniref:Potassium channel KAT3 n=1 Tax=Forsythia ovata TaxID=205694 RepID=A0ABD1W561_9LAMI